MMMRTKSPPTKPMSPVPLPDECAGYREHQAAQTQLADLRRQLAEAQASESVIRDPQRVDTALSRAARQLLDGHALDELSAGDMQSDLDKLRQRTAVLKRAIALAEESADAKRREWVSEVVKATLPHYRALVRQYAERLCDAARAARELTALYDDVFISTDRMLPTVGNTLLGQLNDANSRIRLILDSMKQSELLTDSELRNLIGA